MNYKQLTIFTILIFLTSSCSNYVTGLHDAFETDNQKQLQSKQDQFDFYRKKKSNNNMFIKNNLTTEVTTETRRNVAPPIKRRYSNTKTQKKRYRASDLTDNQGDGSLWVSEDSSNFLFSDVIKKKTGDIILINVLDRLKSEITLELRRTFPIDAPPQIANNPTKPTAPPGTPAPAKAPPKKMKAEDTAIAEIHDRISSIIIEEINKNHLLLKGRKHVLFRGKKRSVEIQVLISRKDLLSDDSVNSNKVLESTIDIIR